jgi:hypothetical protein
LTLLRVGFTEPAQSPAPLVVSYTTVSPLPRRGGAVCSLLHFPSDHSALHFGGTLLCEARTFLSNYMPLHFLIQDPDLQPLAFGLYLLQQNLPPVLLSLCR